MFFDIRLKEQDNLSTLQINPPSAHFAAGTITIHFHNLMKHYAVAVALPQNLRASVATPLHLPPGGRASVTLSGGSPGVYPCYTYVTGPKCPTCGTDFGDRPVKFLYADGRPDPPDPLDPPPQSDPPGEPIIILD
jgi:hypothetical protein